MNSSAWGYLFLVLGIFGIILINLFGNITVSNEDMYYVLKEVTEGAMIDSVDYQALSVGTGYDGVMNSCSSPNVCDINGDCIPCVAEPNSMHCIAGVPGTIRIVKEKFVESFVMRFAESAARNKRYTLSFDDIQECPPKVTVTVTAKESYSFLGRIFGLGNKEYNYDTDAEIVNTLSSILEAK